MISMSFAKAALRILSTGRKQSVPCLSVRMAREMSSGNKYDFETITVKTPSEFVKNVEINRPEKRNAMNQVFVREVAQCFSELSVDPDCRVILLSAAGKVFSSGIDIYDAEFFEALMPKDDPGRNAFKFVSGIKKFQDRFSELEKCPKPVLAAIHNGCLGLAIDLIVACDMRVCTKDAYFEIKEVDLGIAADIGVLQRFPKVVNNDSLARELVYTTRRLGSDEVKRCGFVSRVYENQSEMMEASLKLAQTIASKSPVAVQGSKVNLVYSRDRSVADGLEYTTAWQTGMLQSEDMTKAAQAAFSKDKPAFSKL